MRSTPQTIHGVDFSGGAGAGRKIWIASGSIASGSIASTGSASGTLRIDACRRAEDLPESGVDRERSLTALRAFIASQAGSAVGLDFPFGLPKAVLPQPTWRQFIVSFPNLYASPEAFRQTCYRSAAGRELKRVTDVECKTPFSPYNLRLYRQSYFGMRDVLNPLVRSRQAHVVPMQPARLGKPWLLEICPASTLKQANLYLPYKGKSPRHHAARIGILKWLGSGGRLSLSRTVMRSIVLSDPEGDALDSILAAFATFRAVSDPHRLVDGGRHDYMLEGCVFV